jgi:transmembrane sensor
MQNEEARELLIKYQAGHCNEAEKALVDRWFSQLGGDEVNIPPEVTDEWAKEVFQKLSTKQSGARVFKIWPLSIAASIILTIGIFLYFHKSPSHRSFADKPQTIIPGSNNAFIILANGGIINLSRSKNGIVFKGRQIKYNDGSNVSGPNINLGYHSIITPKGGQYQLRLADGTRVWLNADTRLKFPSSFKGLLNRIVELSGEAYFEVAKDKVHPFIVQAKSQELRVLGTHFNISAYSDEKAIKSTLLEGSIKINGKVTLKPGEEAENEGTSIYVKRVDTDIAVAWKNGEFMFRKETLESILQKVSRWYNVEIVYDDNSLRYEIFNGEISKFSDISRVLNTLQLTNKVNFKVEGRRIMVLK